LINTEAWKKMATQKITVDRDRCTGCGTCAAVCPFVVYEMKKGEEGKRVAVPVYREDCFLCQSCQAQCPADAITIEW
jgi:NAD-dependent dihydropyrimidine dehydrogenase PreA subunit